MYKGYTYLLLAISCLWGYVASAQQVQQFSQFRFVGLSFNPAFAGSDEFFNAMAIHRSQWTGIQDAPRTYLMGMHAPSANGKMGYGGTLFTDAVGPTRRVGALGTYAYHLQTSDKTKLSMGLSFGFTQFSIDGSRITLREQGDPAAIPGMQQEFKPDASFGLLWYSDKWHVGLSANQLLNNKLDFFPGDRDGRMAVHYFLTGAYKFDVNSDFQVEPAILVKYVEPALPSIDVSARVIFKGNLWLGAAYRSQDAATVYAGYDIMDYLTIGYAYDISTSGLRNYTDGSHEILLALRFITKRNTPPDN